MGNANFTSSPYYPDSSSFYSMAQWDNYQFSKKALDNLATFYFIKADISTNTYSYINLYDTVAPEAGAIFNN
jgi:hypothetical protein